MSELRWNPLAQRWVVIAGHREARPNENRAAPASERRPTSDAGCPFCPGNEAETLPPLETVDGPGGDWVMRVVPNKYPSFDGPEPVPTNVETASASGASEVVIFTPRHDEDLADLRVDSVARLLTVVAGRRLEHGRNPAVRHTSIIVNRGVTSGASITHAHAQILSTPFVPPTVATELRGFDEVGDLVASAFGHGGETIVAERTTAVAGCPRWSALPYETWVAPRTATAEMASTDDDQIHDVSALLVEVLRRHRAVLGDVDHNVVVRLPPHDESSRFHWHVHVLPRHVPIAGFELSSGIAVNSIPPEQAAQRLRDAEPVDGGADR